MDENYKYKSKIQYGYRDEVVSNSTHEWLEDFLYTYIFFFINPSTVCLPTVCVCVCFYVYPPPSQLFSFTPLAMAPGDS